MTKRPIIKNRLVAYKLLTILLYHRHLPNLIQPGHDADHSLYIKVGPLSRYLRISVGRCREQLEWLQSNGFIKDLTPSGPRDVLITLRMPGDDWV